MLRVRVGCVVAVLFVAGMLGGCFLPTNRPPEALFTVTYNVDPADPLVVEFDASTSTDPDADGIVSHSWVFGELVNILSPFEDTLSTATVATPILVVRYPVEGTYTISLLVRDEQGASSAPFSRTITLPNLPVEPTL